LRGLHSLRISDDRGGSCVVGSAWASIAQLVQLTRLDCGGVPAAEVRIAAPAIAALTRLHRSRLKVLDDRELEESQLNEMARQQAVAAQAITRHLPGLTCLTTLCIDSSHKYPWSRWPGSAAAARLSVSLAPPLAPRLHLRCGLTRIDAPHCTAEATTGACARHHVHQLRAAVVGGRDH
jgi:hypothetical protein